MKKNYYFSHDMNARNDEKILKLRAEYGWEGYGIYFALLEMLFEDENCQLNLSNLKFISYNLNVRSTTLKKVLNFCFTIGLFQKDENYFWSNGMKKRCEKIKNKIEQTRQAGILSAQKRKEKKQHMLEDSCKEDLTNVKKTSNETPLNNIKGNNIKENNSSSCINNNKNNSVINDITRHNKNN